MVYPLCLLQIRFHSLRVVFCFSILNGQNTHAHLAAVETLGAELIRCGGSTPCKWRLAWSG